MLTTETIEAPDRLAELAPEWEALAATRGACLGTPAWTLGTWRHFRPPGSELRAIAVRDRRGALVAVAPFHSQRQRGGRIDYRLVGGELPRTDVLALPGHEWAAGAAIAQALAAADPRPDIVAFEAGPLASPWPAAVAAGWPGRLAPATIRYHVQDSPTVTLAAGGYDGWLKTKSSNYRSQMRRARRRFEELGGTARLATAATFASDLAACLDLHASRWNGSEASELVARRRQWEALCRDLAATELDPGRLRLHLLEIDGRPISAQLFAAAGTEAMHINGGWDERHADLKPSQLCILDGLADALERGETALDLGPGDQPYKLRMADGNRPVAWTVLAVPGARLPLTAARLAPTVGRYALRRSLRRNLSDTQFERVRTLTRRGTA